MNENKVPLKNLYLGELIELNEITDSYGQTVIEKNNLGVIPYLQYEGENGFIYGEYALATFIDPKHYERKLFQVQEEPDYHLLKSHQKSSFYGATTSLKSSHYDLPLNNQPVSTREVITNSVKLFPSKEGTITEAELVDSLAFLNLKMIDRFNYKYMQSIKENQKREEKGKQFTIGKRD